MLLSKNSVTNVLCSSVTLSSSPMSLKNYVSVSFRLKLCYYNPVFFCYHVSKSHVPLSHTKASPR